MRAKITHGGVTVELDDATPEDVERVLSAIAQRDTKPAFEPIKELAPPLFQPVILPPGWTYPTYPWMGDSFPYSPLITYCTSGNAAEVCS